MKLPLRFAPFLFPAMLACLPTLLTQHEHRRESREEIKTVIARQTLLHDASYPSRIVLPVLP